MSHSPTFLLQARNALIQAIQTKLSCNMSNFTRCFQNSISFSIIPPFYTSYMFQNTILAHFFILYFPSATHQPSVSFNQPPTIYLFQPPTNLSFPRTTHQPLFFSSHPLKKTFRDIFRQRIIRMTTRSVMTSSWRLWAVTTKRSMSKLTSLSDN